MPRRKKPVLDNEIARNIFNELDLYARDEQFYPLQNALFSYMTQPHHDRRFKPPRLVEPKYPELSQGTFDYWFDRLIEDGYVEVDNVTRSIHCTHLIIKEREEMEKPEG